MEVTMQVLKLMESWPPFGQGLFLFLLACCGVGGVIQVCKLAVALFRGWPPPETYTPEE